MKRPVVWFVSAFICGIVLYSYFSPGLLLVMLGCCLYTFFAYRRPIYLILIPALLAGTVSPLARLMKFLISPCVIFIYFGFIVTSEKP